MLLRRQVAEDLAEPRLAADGVVEPERAAREVRALQTAESRGAQVLGALVWLFRVYVLPYNLEAVAGEGQVHVVVRPLVNGQDLEGSAFLKGSWPLALVVRDVAVQEADARPGSRLPVAGSVSEAV